MNKNKVLLVSIFLLFVFLFSIYSYKVLSSYRAVPVYNWDSDFGRDLYFMNRIIKGDFVLTGPQLSFAGLRLSPYYFYLFAPVLFIFNTWKAVVFANVFLFSAVLSLVFFALSRKYNLFYSLLGVLWISLSSYFIFSARSPGNAMSYLPFLVLYLYAVLWMRLIKDRDLLLLGFLAGVIVNFHPAVLPVVFLSFFAKAFKERFSLKKISAWFFSFLLSFLPVLAFEIKNNFVISKTFLSGRYSDYLGEAGMLAGINAEKIIEVFNISLSSSPFGFYLLFFMLLFLIFSSRERIFFISGLIALLVFVLFGRVVYHYFFPYILFLQILVLYGVLRLNKRVGFFILFFSVFLNIFYFPLQYYVSARTLLSVEKGFLQVLREKDIPKKDLNVMLVNRSPLSAVGWEYRFLLEQNGYKVDSLYEYEKSRYLLVVSEMGEVDFRNLNNWEFKPFASAKLLWKEKAENIIVYFFVK